jgi:hypothetical protein
MRARSLVASVGLLSLLVACGGSGHGGGSFASIAPATSGGASVSVPVAPTSSGAGAQPPVGQWMKGDFHVHSDHSFDATSLGDDIATVIRCADVAGLDFTVISDHRNADCLSDPQFLGARTRLVLIPGEEWGGPGHAGAHGLTRAPIMHEEDTSGGPADCVAKIEKTIDDVHSMGGIFILNHAIDDRCPWLWPVDRFDGVEVWNQCWAYRNSADMTQQQLDKWVVDHQFNQPGAPQIHAEARTAVAVQGGGMNAQKLVFYEEYLKSGRHVAASGGGDSHYFFLPGIPTTRVFAELPTKDSILDGFKKCRTMVARSPYAPELELTADRDGDGVFESTVGDRIPIGGTVRFRVAVSRGKGAKLEVVKNGQVFQKIDVTSASFEATFSDAPTTRSWYRVNLYEPLDMTIPHADELRLAVLGSAQLAWLTSLANGPAAGLFGGKLAAWASKAQLVLDTGGPGALWLVIYGSKVGVTIAPVPTKYPRLLIPDAVNRILNVDIKDRDWCTSVLTSPIWVE